MRCQFHLAVTRARAFRNNMFRPVISIPQEGFQTQSKAKIRFLDKINRVEVVFKWLFSYNQVLLK